MGHAVLPEVVQKGLQQFSGGGFGPILEKTQEMTEEGYARFEALPTRANRRQIQAHRLGNSLQTGPGSGHLLLAVQQATKTKHATVGQPRRDKFETPVQFLQPVRPAGTKHFGTIPCRQSPRGNAGEDQIEGRRFRQFPKIPSDSKNSSASGKIHTGTIARNAGRTLF